MHISLNVILTLNLVILLIEVLFELSRVSHIQTRAHLINEQALLGSFIKRAKMFVRARLVK